MDADYVNLSKTSDFDDASTDEEDSNLIDGNILDSVIAEEEIDSIQIKEDQK